MLKNVKNWLRERLIRTSAYTRTDSVYLAKSGFWVTADYALSTVASTALILGFANLVSRDIYGTYRYVLSVAGSLSFLTLTGMNVAVIQAVASGGVNVLRAAVRHQIRWNTLFGVCMAAMAGYYLFQGNHTIGWSLLLLAIGFPLTAALNTYGAYLAGIKDYIRIAKYGAMKNAWYLACVFGAMFVSDSVVILIAAYTIGNLIPNIYGYFRILPETLHRSAEPKIEERINSFGRHLTLVNVLATIDSYLDKVLIFQHIGAVELAVYGIAQAVPERIRGYGKTLGGILIPKLAEKDVTAVRRSFYLRTFQAMAIGGIFASTYYLLAPYIFRLLLPQYPESLQYSRFLSLGLVFTYPTTYLVLVVRSLRMVRAIYLTSVGWHGLRIILFLILGVRFGVWGIVAASLVTQALGMFYGIALWEHQSRRILRLQSSTPAE